MTGREAPSGDDLLYYAALDQIYHSAWSVRKLARITMLRRLIAVLWPGGHPSRFVHVVGTSGKGSTCRFLEAGLAESGPSGALLSPHLFDYRERISVGGEPAPRSAVTEAWEQVVRPLAIDRHLESGGTAELSFSEVTILIALCVFDRLDVEWAAIEAGLGGRYDQTSALDFEATILTNVGDDHQHLLGEHKWQRTLDKAGIIRPGVPVITADHDDETISAVAHISQALGAPFHRVRPEDVPESVVEIGESLDPPRLLAHRIQLPNATVALQAIDLVAPAVDGRAALDRMASVELVGRWSTHDDRITYDIAHNPNKVEALAAEIRRRHGGANVVFVVGVSGKRPAAATLAPLVPLAEQMIVTTSPFRGQPAEAVADELRKAFPEASIRSVGDPGQAVAEAQEATDGPIIVTGSTYVIDAALNPDPYLRETNAAMGWRNASSAEEPGAAPPPSPDP